MVVGNGAHSVASVLVDGANSHLFVGSQTSIGAQTLVIGTPLSQFQPSGPGAGTVTIQNGGDVTSYDEDTEIGPGSLLKITGPNSTLNTGSFRAGIAEDAGGNVQVTAGGSLHASGEFDGTLNVDAASLFFTSGSGGYRGTTTVQNGGSISELQSIVTGTVTIDGATSSWTDSAGLDVEAGIFTAQNQATLDISTISLVGGDLQIGNGGAPGVINGQLMDLASSSSHLIFDHNQTGYSFSEEIDGGGPIIQEGSGTTILSGNNHLFSGPILLKSGELSVGSSTALGTGNPISFLGGTLQYTSQNTTDYSSRFSTAAGQSYSIDTNGNSVTLAGNLTSNGGSLTKLGTGTLTIIGTNTYSGTTTIEAGTVVPLNNTAFGSGNVELTGGELSCNSFVLIGGNYAQTAGTLLLSAAAPAHGATGGNAFLDVAGSITLGGTFEVKATNYKPGQTFNLVLLANSISGSFANVINDQPGDTTLTQSLSTDLKTLTVTVKAAQATYSQWASLNNYAGAALATPKNDGVPNLLKYVYNIQPGQPMTAADRANLPQSNIDTTTTPGTTYVTLTYRQYLGLDPSVSVVAQASSDMQTWQPVTSTLMSYDPLTGDPIMKASAPLTGTGEFIRLQVSRP